MPRVGNDIYVDMRDIKAKMQMLGTVLSEKEINQLQTRVLRDTGKEVKDIASEEIPEEYYIRASTVRKDIKRMQMSNANSGHAQCCIPIEGERHIIGGKTIPAVGGSAGFISISHGKSGRQFRGKRYKIYARILQDKFSVLPEEMTDQGGRPSFRNLTADGKYGSVTHKALMGLLEDRNKGENVETDAPDESDTAETVGKTVAVTGDSVNVRKGPATTYGVMTRVNRGDTMPYVATADAVNWHAIEINGAVGWISGKYTEVKGG